MKLCKNTLGSSPDAWQCFKLKGHKGKHQYTGKDSDVMKYAEMVISDD